MYNNKRDNLSCRRININEFINIDNNLKLNNDYNFDKGE